LEIIVVHLLGGIIGVTFVKEPDEGKPARILRVMVAGDVNIAHIAEPGQGGNHRA